MPREKLNPQKKILGYQPKITLMNVWAMYYARNLGLGKSWKNHGLAIAFDWVRFLAKIWPTLKSTFRTSFESCFHADHNGTIPSLISHSCTKIWCVFHYTGNMEYVASFPGRSHLQYLIAYRLQILRTYYTYVGIGWTIAICMNGTFKWCPFLILSPNTNKGITYGFGSVRYWQITMHQRSEQKKFNLVTMATSDTAHNIIHKTSWLATCTSWLNCSRR